MYLDTHGNGAMEANSLQTVGMHLKHIERTLGEKFPLHALTLADLLLRREGPGPGSRHAITGRTEATCTLEG
jgi:hypothetical protein